MAKKTITAKANQSKRTFTIRTYFDGKLGTTYRTLPMTKKEFESAEGNTERDWQAFLNYENGSYYAVK